MPVSAKPLATSRRLSGSAFSQKTTGRSPAGPPRSAQSALAPSDEPPAAPEPAVLSVEIDTRPSGAEVSRDGEVVGETPLAVTWAAGVKPPSLVLRRGDVEATFVVDVAHAGTTQTIDLPAPQAETGGKPHKASRGAKPAARDKAAIVKKPPPKSDDAAPAKAPLPGAVAVPVPAGTAVKARVVETDEPKPPTTTGKKPSTRLPTSLKRFGSPTKGKTPKGKTPKGKTGTSKDDKPAVKPKPSPFEMID